MDNTHFYDFLIKWKQLPLENGLPSISSLEKIDLGPLKNNIFILERWVNDYMPVHKFGNRLKSIYGLDMKGLNFLGLFEGHDRAVVANNINNMLDYECGGLVGWLGIRPGGEYMEIRNYGLPFRSTDGEANHIVGFTEVVNQSQKAMLSPGKISIWPVKRSKLFDLGKGIPEKAHYEVRQFAKLI